MRNEDEDDDSAARKDSVRRIDENPVVVSADLAVNTCNRFHSFTNEKISVIVFNFSM